MHERAGHSMYPMQKIKIESQFRKAQIKPITKKVEASSTERISDSPPNAVEANIFHSDSSTEKVTLPAAMASKTLLSMTRRFSIAEKLTIIESFKVLENISASCRWVRNKFHVLR